MRTCAFCGRQAEEAETLTWSQATEGRRTVWHCDTCAREHLRSIEAKLDSEWW
ncbi:MAG: hypothetical protein ACI379_02825 [Nocardioides sp.]|uniref:hypothetical protein n=1 Tax=Nocardioides sp. TaxID=35761 RepID=UPI003F03648D